MQFKGCIIDRYVIKDVDTCTLKRIKNATSKNGILGFHNKVMTLHVIHKTTYITRLPFVFSFSHRHLRLVCDVTCYVIL